jgi:hypothetical protein
LSVEEAVELLPARSMAAPALICSVRVPSLFGLPRLTVNVYGPEPEPVTVPADQLEEVPPMVTPELEKPVTDSENETEQLRLVAFVRPGAGKQVKLDTVGAIESST